MNERLALVNSKDYGEDEPTAQSLLQRHRDLHGELKAYQGDVQSLNAQAERLITLGISSLQVSIKFSEKNTHEVRISYECFVLE